jgi:integrase
VLRQLKKYRKDSDVIFDKVKTDSGRRKIKLEDQTIEILRSHLNRQMDKRRHPRKGTWKDYDLIFPSILGTPIDQTNLYRDFKANLKLAGLDKGSTGHAREASLHDFRHTAASLMLNHGVPVIVVSKHMANQKFP